MLVKHVICEVPTDTSGTFFAGQHEWTRLRSVHGFVVQFGGYAQGQAHIVGVWATSDTYRLFMAEFHDQIAARADQSRSYSRIDVALYELRSPKLTAQTISAALLKAKHLQINTSLLSVPHPGGHTPGGNLLSMVGRRLLSDGRSSSTVCSERAEFTLHVRGQQGGRGEAWSQSDSPKKDTQLWVDLVPAWSVTNAPTQVTPFR